MTLTSLRSVEMLSLWPRCSEICCCEIREPIHKHSSLFMAELVGGCSQVVFFYNNSSQPVREINPHMLIGTHMSRCSCKLKHCRPLDYRYYGPWAKVTYCEDIQYCIYNISNTTLGLSCLNYFFSSAPRDLEATSLKSCRVRMSFFISIVSRVSSHLYFCEYPSVSTRGLISHAIQLTSSVNKNG